MSAFSVDVEADGPIPGPYSMTEFGLVKIDKEGKFDIFFHGKCKPISDIWVPEALAISGKSREEVMDYPEPEKTMKEAYEWVMDNNKSDRPKVYSDNNGFDNMFLTWYFHKFYGKNPFGWSSNNIKNIYQGIMLDCFTNHKKLRKTKHSHHPVDDAKGNAEALHWMVTNKKLRMDLK